MARFKNEVLKLTLFPKVAAAQLGYLPDGIRLWHFTRGREPSSKSMDATIVAT
jgi:hypothetical protein